MRGSTKRSGRKARDDSSADATLLFGSSLITSEPPALFELLQEQVSRELHGLQATLLWALDWPGPWSPVSPRTLSPAQSALLQTAVASPQEWATGCEASASLFAQCAASGTSRVALLCTFDGEANTVPERITHCKTFFAKARPYLLNALQKARLQKSVEQLERSEKLQHALFAIADIARAEMDMPDVLSGLHEIVRSLMYAENFFIALRDPVGDTIRFIYYADVADKHLPKIGERIPMAEREFSLTWYLIRDGHPLMGSHDELRSQVSGPLQVRGEVNFQDWLGVPMTHGDVVYGALVVQSYGDRRRYTSQDQALLSFVAGHILNALERKQDRDELERRVEERTFELAQINRNLEHEVGERRRGERLQAALYQIAALTSTEKDTDRYFAQIHRIISGLLDGESFYIALLSEDGLTLTFPYVQDTQDHSWPSEPRGRGRTEYVLRTRHTQSINRTRVAELVALGELDSGSAATRARVWLGVPLLAGERPLGVLAVQSYTNEHAYTAADVELIEFVAAQLASSLQHRRDTAERERTERLHSVLYQIEVLSNTDESTDRFFEHVHSSISALLNADNFYIALLSVDGDMLEFAYWVNRCEPHPAARPLGCGLTEYALRSERTQLVESRQAARALIEAGEIDENYLNSITRCWLGAPLIGNEGALGVVAVQSYAPDVKYDQRDAELLTFVSFQLASSIQRRRAAEALRLSNVRLEERVAERTRELSEQISERELAQLALRQRNSDLELLNRKLTDTKSQLLQSEKMASIGQLAAGVAHEINNPIGYVRSNLTSLGKYVQKILSLLQAYENLENTPLNAPPDWATVRTLKQTIELDYLREDIVDLLTESVDGVMRVEKIVKDLKDFSRLDQAEWQQVDIHGCIDSTLNVVAHELKYKAEIVKEYGSLPPIECYPFQIQQVFMNVLVNAAHAIEGHGTVTIRTGCDTDTVWVSVSDSGKGIAPSDLKRIFEPFFTTKPIGQGTGLGLSVSYGIVQKHGGSIEVASEPGQDTTFTIRLPIDQQHDIDSAPPTTA